MVAAEPIGGGSINVAERLTLDDGRAIFLKHRSGAAAAEFEAEASGLAWLAEAEAVAVPEVAARGAGAHPWLALEWVEPGALSAGGAAALGRGLARLHRAGADRHGALPPGAPDDLLRIGPLSLDLGEEGRSSRNRDWPEFYAERLLMPTLASARDRGGVSAGEAVAVERVCARIERYTGPPEPPARLHGDLWGGNVLPAADGRPWLIDPAAYGGHREVDLAMLRLFGTPGGERVFAAYEEVWPLADGHRERVELWQIFPLLVHAALFGGSYGARAAAAASAYL